MMEQWNGGRRRLKEPIIPVFQPSIPPNTKTVASVESQED